MNKALKAPVEPVAGSVPFAETDDFDRMSKVLNALSTPFENGEPKLEKGMYTINRFSNILSDMASLARCIKSEGVRENSDSEDDTVSDNLMSALKTLGDSFKTYVSDQIDELMAGMDDDVVVTYYDYYYNAAQVDPENGMAKDVCSVLSDHKDASRERRDSLAKAWGVTDDEPTVDVSEALQKRFSELEATANEMKKVAEDAVAEVEKLTKRVKQIEDTPLPRAPVEGGLALREGDSHFFGKRASSDEERLAILNDMLKTHGPEGMAIQLIKAAHTAGGAKLSLNT